MKKISAVILSMFAIILMTAMPSFAQDAKAKAILDKLSANVKSMNTLNANFTFIAKDAKGKETLTKKGTFSLQGNKFKVNLGEQELICDGQNMWTYMKKNKEVQVASYDPKEQTISPAKLFSGSYTNDYKYKYAGEKTVNGKKVDAIVLEPKSGKAFKNVILFVDKAGMINSGTITETNGSLYSYSISNVTSPKFDAATFTFDEKKNPGVEVIDLR